MNISYSKAFKKKFAKYERKLQQKIFNAITRLPNGDVKKMIGNDITVIFRLRVSKYRILFQMTDDEIKILEIDTRGDIYKK